MKDRDTPLALVRYWRKISPQCFEQLDACRAAKDDGVMQWPDYCALPINAAHSYLVACEGLTPEEAGVLCAELTACYVWRQNKIIYAYDPAMAALLAEQAEEISDHDVLPAALLLHLPYPCIYIKAPGILEHTDGFWAWIDYDAKRNAPELRIQWVLNDLRHSFPQVMHIIPGGTIEDCFLDTVRATEEYKTAPVDISRPADSSRIILKAIQLILYLVADNAEIEDEPAPVRVADSKKKNPRIVQDKASEVKAKSVGIRIGNAIRREQFRASAGAKVPATGNTKRPHMRRGHWHHYWTGPKNGDRILKLKWTAPTMIHADAGSDDNVVVYPVKK